MVFVLCDASLDLIWCLLVVVANKAFELFEINDWLNNKGLCTATVSLL